MTPVALLLPGMTLNATVFPDLGIPTIAMEFTRLIVGADGWSPELAEKRMSFYVERLADRLRREPAWQASRRIVVGHSFGGLLALAWLLECAGDPLARVDGLVLIGTSAGPMYRVVRLRLLGGERWALRVPIGRLMWLWNHPAITRAVARLTAHGAAPRDIDFRQRQVRSDITMGLAGWLNTDWRARRSYRFAMEGFDIRDRLRELAVPTIVLHGPRDTFFPVSVARAYARRLPRAELRIVPGAAHALPLTHGEDVVRAVRDLLGP